MVNPGVFRGVRGEFMHGELAAYRDAVAGAYVKDAIATIQRRYFKRFPIDLPHDEDPTPEELASVDDDTAEPEPEQPDENKLSPEEYQAAMKQVEVRAALLQTRKGQIARWLHYHYMKESDADSKDHGPNNPVRMLMHQLTGVNMIRPRQQAPAHFWRKNNRHAIDAEVERRANSQKLDRKKLAPIREKVVKDLFNAVSTEQKEHWKRVAKEDHEAVIQKWETDMKTPLSDSPEARQKCIQGLTHFIKPILDLICDATGWKATFVAGGPEPAHGGRLNMLSVHSGTTPGSVKMNFGRCEQARYQSDFVPMFSSFLRKCYTPAECRARALPDRDFDRIANLDLENADLNNLEDAIPLDDDQPESYTTPSTNFSAPNGVDDGATLAFSDPPLSPNAGCERPNPTSDNADLSNLLNDPQLTVLSSSRALTPVARSPPRSPVLSLAPSPAHSPPRSAPPSRLPTPAPSPCPRPAPSPPRNPTVPNDLERVEPRPLAQPSDLSSPAIEESDVNTSSAHEHTPLPPLVATSPDKARPAEMAIEDPAAKSTTKSTLRKRKTMELPPLPPVATASDGERPAKRARKMTAKAQASIKSSSAAAVTDGIEAPPWFDESMAMLSTAEFGPSWEMLLEAWAAFEVIHSYKEIRRLTHKSRPTAIKTWIDKGRPTTWRPAPFNAKQFGRDFDCWWLEAQPKWRVHDGKLLRVASDGDWKGLRSSGQNGVISALVALFWWGLALGRNLGHDVEWHAAVDDLTYVLECMCSV